MDKDRLIKIVSGLKEEIDEWQKIVSNAQDEQRKLRTEIQEASNQYAFKHAKFKRGDRFIGDQGFIYSITQISVLTPATNEVVISYRLESTNKYMSVTEAELQKEGWKYIPEDVETKEIPKTMTVQMMKRVRDKMFIVETRHHFLLINVHYPDVVEQHMQDGIFENSQDYKFILKQRDRWNSREYVLNFKNMSGRTGFASYMSIVRIAENEADLLEYVL